MLANAYAHDSDSDSDGSEGLEHSMENNEAMSEVHQHHKENQYHQLLQLILMSLRIWQANDHINSSGLWRGRDSNPSKRRKYSLLSLRLALIFK